MCFSGFIVAPSLSEKNRSKWTVICLVRILALIQYRKSEKLINEDGEQIMSKTDTSQDWFYDVIAAEYNVLFYLTGYPDSLKSCM